jgi:hypothetical protein
MKTTNTQSGCEIFSFYCGEGVDVDLLGCKAAWALSVTCRDLNGKSVGYEGMTTICCYVLLQFPDFTCYCFYFCSFGKIFYTSNNSTHNFLALRKSERKKLNLITAHILMFCRKSTQFI